MGILYANEETERTGFQITFVVGKGMGKVHMSLFVQKQGWDRFMPIMDHFCVDEGTGVVYVSCFV